MLTFRILLAILGICFFLKNILLRKFTPSSLLVCESGILQRGISKLKCSILTPSSYRATSVSQQKWRLMDVMPRRALRDSVSLCTSPSTTLPKSSDGATERCCLKCASTWKNRKVKAASVHLARGLAGGTHN